MRRIRMRRAHRAGVRAIVTSGVAPNDWSDALKIADEITGAQQAPSVYAGLGLHPYAVSSDAGRNREALERLESLLETRATSPDLQRRWIALGECGLDFRKGMPFASKEIQIAALEAQLQLAQAHQLPVVLHCVAAHGALLELLDSHQLVPSILHAFSGSAEMAERFSAKGHYISFAGNLTRGDAKKVHRACQAVALERLLIESDSPDQTPQGRGAVPNEPAFVEDIARALAHHRNEDFPTLARASYENATRVYRVNPPRYAETP